MLAALAAAAPLTQRAPAQTQAAVIDSGWSVASPVAPASPLGPSRVEADRFLGPRTLEKIQLPAREPQQRSSLEWRPVRTAQRPAAEGRSELLPPPRVEQPTVTAPPAAPQQEAVAAPELNNAFQVPNLPQIPAVPESQAPPEAVAAAPKTVRAPEQFDADAARPIAEAPAAAPPAETAETRDEPGPELDPADAPTLTLESPAPLSDGAQSPADDAAPAAQAVPPSKAEPPARTDSPTTEAAPEEAPRGERSKQPASSKSFATPKEVERPQRPLPPLSRNEQNLRQRLRSVLSYYYRRPLNSEDHDAWEVMHSMLAYGLYSRVQDGGRTGKPVTAVGYLCFNKPCERYQMLYLTPEGNLDVRVGVGMQGHKGQLLAMLAQCNVSPDYPIHVEGQEFTVRDLIAAEQLTCYERSELTFKLIGLLHYLPSDTTWVNDQGERWDFPKLIADERTQKIRGAACGGTHRLSGLALAAKKRVARGEPLDGEWLEAANFVKEYQQYALRMQNRDGSLSTEWFRGPGDEEDIDRRIRTTGHTLEWLIYSLPEEQLTERPVFAAVNYLTSLITSNTDNGWEIGSLSHALHALALYDQKVFEPYDDPTGTRVAGRMTKQVSLNYKNLQSGISENYYFLQARHEERVARQNSGLGGLFGFGGSSRRSR